MSLSERQVEAKAHIDLVARLNHPAVLQHLKRTRDLLTDIVRINPDAMQAHVESGLECSACDILTAIDEIEIALGGS